MAREILMAQGNPLGTNIKIGLIIHWSERKISEKLLASKDCHPCLFRDCYLGVKDPRLHL